MCMYRCGIPVVIMGETGCGKTRLIRYMCELAKQAIDKKLLKEKKLKIENIENMKILKVLFFNAVYRLFICVL